jgi:hypothetical protein
MEDFFTPFILICENKKIKNHDPSNSKIKNKNFQPLRRKKTFNLQVLKMNKKLATTFQFYF